MTPYIHQLFETDIIKDRFVRFYIDQLYAYMSAYASEVPATWSFLYENLQDFDDAEEIILRDGVISLLDFFMRFPIPSDCKTHFYVSSELVYLVPDKWKNNVGTFELHSNNQSQSAKLIVSGIPSSESIERVLKKLFETNVNYTEIVLIYPDRQFGKMEFNVYQNIDIHYAFMKFLTALQIKFPETNIKTSLDSSIGSVQNIKEYGVFDISPYSVEISDSLITHRLLSNGACLINTEKKMGSNDEKYEMLSLNHGFKLKKRIPEEEKNFYEDFTVKSILADQSCWKRPTELKKRYFFTDELYYFCQYCISKYGQ